MSCRCCGRDLTPVLPLLRRLEALEERCATLEKDAQEGGAAVAAAPAPALAAIEETHAAPPAPLKGLVARRRYLALPIGFAALFAVYCMVVLWLDLPLYVLRFASIAIPFGAGVIYLGLRPRLTWFDAGIAVAFAIFSVASMNALLGWSDNIPLLPQGSAAWRETLFYALSIGASMFSGMLLRVTQAALTARGLVSLPQLRKGLLAVNGKVPADMLKAIEMTILLASTIFTAIAGLIAGILGVK